jgi:hypothetical protein
MASSVTFTVQNSLPEVGVAFADADDGSRFFIDAQSANTFELKPGRQIRAVVNDEGYVLSAELLPD